MATQRKTNPRAGLRRLVDQLPDREIGEVRRYLEYLRYRSDPFLKKLLDAPYDDEPLTAEDKKALREARREARRGDGRPWEEVRKELIGGD